MEATDITTILSKSIIFILFYFLINVGITIYSIYLSKKQANVFNEVKELNNTAKEIKAILESKSK